MGIAKEHQLLVTIIPREKTEKILNVIEEAGVKQSAVLLDRWISDNNPTLLFNVKIEPQCEVICTIVPKKKANLMAELILAAGEIKKHLNGFVMVLDLDNVWGL